MPAAVVQEERGIDTMTESRYDVTVEVDGPLTVRMSVTISEIAFKCGCRVDVVKRLVDFGLVDPIEGPPDVPLFSPMAVSRVSRALRLKRDLGLNLNSLALVMELLDRIEELEDRLRRG
jgi:chaperone modulatory protein CbpM